MMLAFIFTAMKKVLLGANRQRLRECHHRRDLCRFLKHNLSAAAPTQVSMKLFLSRRIMMKSNQHREMICSWPLKFTMNTQREILLSMIS